jgi:hypothetical protein
MTEYRLCYLTLQYFLGPRILLELTKELKRSKEERQNVDFTGRFRPIVFLTLSLPAVSTSDNSTQTLSPWIFATQKSLFPGEICILKFTNCSSTLKVANLILKKVNKLIIHSDVSHINFCTLTCDTSSTQFFRTFLC